MRVVPVAERRAPRLAEARRPPRSVPLATEPRHLVQLPVQHRELVRLDAVLARAAEAQPQGQMEHIAVGCRSYEPDGFGAMARERLERLERRANMRPHERPAQPPRILRVDVG